MKRKEKTRKRNKKERKNKRKKGKENKVTSTSPLQKVKVPPNLSIGHQSWVTLNFGTFHHIFLARVCEAIKVKEKLENK